MPLPPLIRRRDLTRNLHATEHDGNIDNFDGRLIVVEAAIPAAARGVVGATIVGDQLTIEYTDATFDVLAVPVASWNFTNEVGDGAWLPSEGYLVNDVFIANLKLYRVIFSHTSGLTFDPAANDGMGHNFYKELLAFPPLTFDDIGGALAFADITGALSVTQLRSAGAVTPLGTTGTVTLNPALGDLFTLTPTGDVTLNASATPANANVTIDILTSGSTSRAVLFGTGFVSQGPLDTGTDTAKHFSITFRGTGTALVEVARTAAM